VKDKDYVMELGGPGEAGGRSLYVEYCSVSLAYLLDGFQPPYMVNSHVLSQALHISFTCPLHSDVKIHVADTTSSYLHDIQQL